jgi:mono/diheme cytochrome c family protein
VPRSVCAPAVAAAALAAVLSLACSSGTSALPDAQPQPDAGAADGGQALDAGPTSDAGPTTDAEPSADAEPTTDAGTVEGCLAPETVSATMAEAGRALILERGLGGRFAPRLALENLWLVWPNAAPGAFWPAFRARYGFAQDPRGGELPAGFKDDGQGWLTVDCLACHAGTVAGRTLVGAAANRADLQLLIEDLTRLARQFGAQVPTGVTVRTGARGVSDIVGMTMQLARPYAPPGTVTNTEIGYQDPPAWWTLKHKSRIYVDGSASAATHRSMMATLLAFGLTLDQIAAREDEFIGLRQYLLTLEAPRWPFEAPDPAKVARGQEIFRASCARCHGDDRCERVESVIVPRAEIGTDPERSEEYAEREVGLINASWFGGDEPHRATGGYVAPSLRGVWASAPYLHNGSAPTLADVLESARRPRYFRVRGTTEADYDRVNVGLAVDVLDAPGPRPAAGQPHDVYDTTQPGLGNAGHTFGDGLSAEDRAAVIEFLKTL